MEKWDRLELDKNNRQEGVPDGANRENEYYSRRSRRLVEDPEPSERRRDILIYFFTELRKSRSGSDSRFIGKRNPTKAW